MLKLFTTKGKPNSSSSEGWAILLCMLGAGLLVGLTQHEPFFWDTVQLGAMQGDWFYQQQFSTWLLPERIDSGHIPAFGWYLAFCWQLFGQNLTVSHWAMWPWITLVTYQWWRLLGQTNSRWSQMWGMGLLLASPVIMSQLTLISPDIILIACFLLAWNSILNHRRSWLTIAIILLGLVSMRGMLVALALFSWQVYRDWPTGYGRRGQWLFHSLLPYLPAGLLALAYLVYHYMAKGWIVVHDESPWAASFAMSRGWQMLRQSFILGWRLVDFGYLFIWAGLMAWYWRRLQWSKENTETVSLLVVLLLFLGLPILMGNGLAQHRYLLPCFLVLSYLLWQLASYLTPSHQARIFGVIILLGLFSGNFWVYPVGIAQGWDATLSHKAFFSLQNQSKNFLNEENILTNELSSEFPLLAPQHYYWLNGDSSKMQAYTGSSSLKEEKSYVLYSNVVNTFEIQDLEQLNSSCDIIFHRSRLGVVMTIYDFD